MNLWTPKKRKKGPKLTEKETEALIHETEIPKSESFSESVEEVDGVARNQNKINRRREIFALLGVLFRDDIATAGEDFKALSSHSKLRKTNPGTILPKEEIEMALHYMKFASASYGWKLVYGLEPKKEVGIFQCLAKTSRANTDGIVAHTGVQKEDILMRTAKTKGMIPGFYLALDHKTKSLVLAIRGTQTISDTLTDLVASAYPFLNGWAHKGMVYSALRLQEKIQGVVTETLAKYPDYKMVFVGHSLGAGIATILTLLYREENPNAPIFCYAYAPPCTVSQKLAIMARDFIRSYIFGDDVIPRLTYNSIQQIRAMLSPTSFRKTAEKRHLLMTRYILDSKATTYPTSPKEVRKCESDPSDLLFDSENLLELPQLKEDSLEEEIIVSPQVTSVMFDDVDGAIAESLEISDELLTHSTTQKTDTGTETKKDTHTETDEGKNEKRQSQAEVKVPQVEVPSQTFELQFTEKEAQTFFPAGVIYHMIPSTTDVEQISNETEGVGEPKGEPTTSEKKEKSYWWTRKKKRKKIIKTTEIMYWELEQIVFSLNMFNHHLPPFYEYAFRRLLHQSLNCEVSSKEKKPVAPTLSQRMLASIPRLT